MRQRLNRFFAMPSHTEFDPIKEMIGVFSFGALLVGLISLPGFL